MPLPDSQFVEFEPLPGINLQHPGRCGKHIDVLTYKWLDSRCPTAVIFDKFCHPIVSPRPEFKGIISHGRVSADAAERNGYNVIRVAEKSPGLQLHLDQALPELIAFIDEGIVPIGRGDVLNISAVKSIPFTTASKLLSMTITAGNLSDLVPVILQRMEEVTLDLKQPAPVKEFFRRQLGSNRAVQQIRNRNVEVIVAGGNDGPDWFNVALLTATTQLSAKDAHGRIASWSANNSLTTPATGEFEIVCQRDAITLRPRPAS